LPTVILFFTYIDKKKKSTKQSTHVYLHWIHLFCYLQHNRFETKLVDSYYFFAQLLNFIGKISLNFSKIWGWGCWGCWIWI